MSKLNACLSKLVRMIPISSWAVAAREELLSSPPVAEQSMQEYQLTVCRNCHGLWAVGRWPKGKLACFRMAYYFFLFKHSSIQDVKVVRLAGKVIYESNLSSISQAG